MYIRWRKLKAIAKSLNNGATLSAACEGASMTAWTLWHWRKDNPKIDLFIAGLLDNQIQVVEDALFRRATGYTYEEVTKEKEESKFEKRVGKVIIKEIPSDVTACIFFLTNRAPDRWKNSRALINNTNVVKIEQENRYKDLKDEDMDSVLEGFFKRR